MNVKTRAARQDGRSGAKGDVAYRWLRRGIIEFRFRPGLPLSDRALARRIGVSRTPVREALQRLSQEGLVELHPMRGAAVAEIRIPEVLELLRIRRVLEGLAVRLAAPQIPLEHLTALREHFQQVLSQRVEVRDALKRGERLHVCIIEASGDRTLGALLAQLRERLRWAQGFAWSYWRAAGDVSETQRRKAQEHLAIIDALLARDGAAASKAMEDHIEGARRDFLQLVTGSSIHEVASTLGPDHPSSSPEGGESWHVGGGTGGGKRSRPGKGGRS